MAFNIGLNVIETEGRAAPAIAGAPTSVAGLLLRSHRSPTDRAVRVSNFQQFVARFGGHDPRFVGAYCMEGFFLNGGREAHVGRVVGSGSSAASVTLKDRSGNNTLTVTAGYRGVAEAGSWGNDLYVDIRDNPEFSTRLAATLDGHRPARLQWNALGVALDLSVPAGNPPRTLSLDVDDPATRMTTTFDRTALPVPAQAMPQDIVDAINAQAGSRVVAAVEGGGILLISRTKGASSRMTVVTGIDDDTRNRLGFPDGTTTASVSPAPTLPIPRSRWRAWRVSRLGIGYVWMMASRKIGTRLPSWWSRMKGLGTCSMWRAGSHHRRRNKTNIVSRIGPPSRHANSTWASASAAQPTRSLSRWRLGRSSPSTKRVLTMRRRG